MPISDKMLSHKHIVPLNLDQEWFVNPTSLLINNLSDLLGKEKYSREISLVMIY